MDKRKKNWRIGIGILLVIACVGLIFFLFFDDKDDSDVVLKENVVIITDETEEDLQPYEIRKKELYFRENPKYEVGDVIVSGITHEASAGYIRRVIEISQEDGQYIYHTEDATLLDVFEELHISKTIVLTDSEQAVDNRNRDKYLLAYNGNFLPMLSFGLVIQPNPDDVEDLIGVEFSGTVDENISLEGCVGVKLWLDIRIDIEDGNIVWEMTANDNIHGNVKVSCEASVGVEFEEELFNKELPPIQFMAGPVPIVITNEVKAQLEGGAELEGGIVTELEVQETHSAGFVYKGESNTIEEINNTSFEEGGVNWETDLGVSGTAGTGVYVYLTSLLYDCSGANIAVGVKGEASGQVGIKVDNLTNEYTNYGSLSLSVYPELKGAIVVEIPIIGEELAETELFNIALSPLWEKEWKVENEDGNVMVDEERLKLTEDALFIYRNIVNATITQNENEEKIYFEPYYMMEWSAPDSWVGGYTSGYPSGGELVYGLKEVRKASGTVPELFIGVKNNEQVRVLAVYSFSEFNAMGDAQSHATLMTVKKIEDSGEILYVAWDLDIYESDFSAIFPTKSYGFGSCCDRETFKKTVDMLEINWMPLSEF